MKHHAFMLWSLLIFSFHVLVSSGHCSDLQQASWDIFIYDFGSKTPQPPTNTDKKQARQISSPSCPTTKPMMSAPTNDARKGNTFSRT
ncbi:virulence protein PagD [Salmonella enterica]|nr:virulence protein PagD [Salmonella enterica]